MASIRLVKIGDHLMTKKFAGAVGLAYNCDADNQGHEQDRQPQQAPFYVAPQTPHGSILNSIVRY